MNKEPKGGNTLWVVLTIICLLSAGALSYFMLQERAQRLETEAELLEQARLKKAIQNKLDQTQLELIHVKDQAKMLEQELVTRKRAYQKTLDTLERGQQQVKRLERELTNERKQRRNLNLAFAQLKQNYTNLAQRLTETKQKTELLHKELEQPPVRTGVELKKIVVKPRIYKLSGTVLVVNKEFNFVVIDLGLKQGIKVGDEFLIYQDSEEIAKIRVEKVYDLMSTASILFGSQKDKISEEDIVTNVQ
jgi:hypothetical protein